MEYDDEHPQGTSEQFRGGDEVPASLRGALAVAQSWQKLAQRTQDARLRLHPSVVNAELERAAAAERAAPTAPAYRLWIADNLSWEGRWDEAIRACDAVVDAGQDADLLLPGVDPSLAARQRRAEVAAAAGYVDQALASWREVGASGESSEQSQEAVLAAGLFAESVGREEEAVELYASIAASEDAALPSPRQLARRAALRLEHADEVLLPSPAACGTLVTRALEDRDVDALDQLASRSHFTVGFAGGHFRFEDASAA